MFTTDLSRIFLGFILFMAVLPLPGFALGWLTNVFQFRSRTLAFRLAAATPLGIAFAPIVGYTLGLNATLLFLALSVIAVPLLARNSWVTTVHQCRCFTALLAIWIAIAAASLTDLRIGNRLYYSVIAFDYTVRVAFTNSIATWGVPARNPFFYPGHPVGLRYHYFWMIPSALVSRLSGGSVDARQAFIAASIWCGIGLMCLIPLYLRLFSKQGSTNIYRRSIIGAALLGVTGLDILPTLLMSWFAHTGLIGGVSPSVEWWNNQVDGFFYSMLWEPHYVCALIACFTGFLILRAQPQRIAAAVLAGIAFASAVGAGIYIVFIFAPFLVIFTSTQIARKDWKAVRSLAIAGAVAMLLTIPYVQALRATGGSGGELLQWTMRPFYLGEIFLKLFGLSRQWQLTLGNAILLPVNYFLELGFFFAAAWMSRKSLGRTAWLMAAVSIVICTFVRSGVITNNDLGWRGFLIAQFIFLLAGADLLDRHRTKLLTALLVIGATGVVYDLAILRFYPILSDAGSVPKIDWMSPDQHLGERTLANRDAYEWLQSHSPSGAIIQQNPNPVYQDTFYGLYANRQTVAADKACGTGFGGNPHDCAALYAQLESLYSKGGTRGLKQACESLRVTYFIAKDTDPGWLTWNAPTVFENQFVKISSCR